MKRWRIGLLGLAAAGVFWTVGRSGPAPSPKAMPGPMASLERTLRPPGDADRVAAAPADALDPPAAGSREAMLAEVDRLWDEPAEAPEMAAVERRLRRFLLRGVSFRDADLGRVMAHLRARMAGLGSADLADSLLRIEGRASGRVTLTTDRQVSAWAVLRLAAAQAGVELVTEADGGVILRASGAGSADDRMTRAVEIRAADLASWMAEAGFLDSEAAAGGDPFEGSAARTGPPTEMVRAFLESFGLALPDDGWVDFDPVSGHLAVHGMARDAALVEAVAGLADTRDWPQIYLKTRLAKIEDAGPIADQVLAAGDLELLLEASAGDAGIEILEPPSVVTRPGQTARIEMVQDTAVAGPDGAPEVEPRGFVLAIDPAVEGERDVHLRGSFDLSRVDPSVAPPADRQVTDFESTLRNGEAAALMVFEDGSGGRVLALVTAELIDPAGQPIHAAADPAADGRR